MTNKAKDRLTDLGRRLVAYIRKKQNPYLDVPVRSISNISYDTKTRTLKLGANLARRYFFNVAHAKKFLQTVEVASICKDLLKEGKHASLRDVFYMAKRTIPQTSTNLVDDQ